MYGSIIISVHIQSSIQLILLILLVGTSNCIIFQFILCYPFKIGKPLKPRYTDIICHGCKIIIYVISDRTIDANHVNYPTASAVVQYVLETIAAFRNTLPDVENWIDDIEINLIQRYFMWIIFISNMII